MLRMSSGVLAGRNVLIRTLSATASPTVMTPATRPSNSAVRT